MFHVELREASHRLHRFNLTDAELRASVLEPWVRGEPIEMGERVWSPAAGHILVLNGPEIPVGRLTMGRGWSVAQREGADVTTKALAQTRETLSVAAEASAERAIANASSASPLGLPGAVAPGVVPGPIASGRSAESVLLTGRVGPDDAEVLADALGLELLRSLGETPMSLSSAWQAAAQRHPRLPPGVALDLAHRAVVSLVRSDLVSLSREGAGAGLRGPELDTALAQIDSWSAGSGSGALWLRRA